MNETKVSDIVSITTDDIEKELIQKCCKAFGYYVNFLSGADDLLNSTTPHHVVILSENLENKQESLDELAQISFQQNQTALLIAFVQKELTQARFDFLEKLGVKIIMLKREMKTGKFPFLLNQILQYQYISIKTADLFPDKKIPFEVFHCLNVNKSFIKLNKREQTYTKERIERLSATSEYFIKKDDVSNYNKFITENTDRSAKGLAQRCRVNFIHLQVEFQNLVVELTNETNKVSFKEGAALLERCHKLCEEFIMNLAEFKKPWDIITLSEIGNFGSVSRAPAVAAFAGLFAINCEFDHVPKIMLAALIVDLAQLKLDSNISFKLMQKEPLNSDEVLAVQTIPQKSLNLVLERKLAIDEKIRSLMAMVYERADGKGYPLGVDENKISLESQVIRFAKEFDSRITFNLGNQRENPSSILKNMFKVPELEGVFTSEFKTEIQNNILIEL
jgi:response regulator RpfG family c-di-GMP phosphodiesterase